MPEFSICSMRRFEKGEHHISRVFEKSVLLLVFDGVLRFEENGKQVEILPGEYYIQRAGFFQSGRRESDEPVYFYIHFSAEFSENPDDGIPIRGRFPVNSVRRIADEYERIIKMHENSYFLLSSLMYRIFAEIEMGGVTPDSKRTAIAKDIRRYINTEFSSNITISKIAERYGYSDDYTIKLFRQEYGITPYQYIIKQRLSCAQGLLYNTDMSAEEISREVGYNDFSTFYRDFRKHFGISPRSARNMDKTDADTVAKDERDPLPDDVDKTSDDPDLRHKALD